MKDWLIRQTYRSSINKANFYFLIILFSAFGIYCGFSYLFSAKDHSSLQSGDIIFQTTQSAQCKAVQLATHSIYSHCAILYKEGDQLMVYEAVQPVKLTPFDEWITHGKDDKYVVKRLKNAPAILTPAVLGKMKTIAERYKGKNYDIYFGWNDDRIYCSELVWKIYKQGAGIEVGKLQQLKDFDLSSEPVKEKLRERYGNNVPLNDTVISPESIFESDNLVTVAEE
ncbi:MAG: YiiX family permuted papain-like enzyme [Bacteroidia bacterium]